MASDLAVLLKKRATTYSNECGIPLSAKYILAVEREAGNTKDHLAVSVCKDDASWVLIKYVCLLKKSESTVDAYSHAITLLRYMVSLHVKLINE